MNVHTASIGTLQSALRSGRLTPTQLLEAHIQRIETVNPWVNGLVKNRYARARAEAKDAEKTLQRGGEDIPVLTGIPCTIKEFLGVHGMPQTGGVLWRQETKSTSDATVVQRLREAGAIIMGVTNIPEGGLWLETYNAIYGRTKNPWNLKRTSGGSSGGEAVLVSSGASPFGLGSDVGGSIRIPAAFCGTVGHKPTGGLVPNTGHYPEGALTSKGGRYLTVGPLTRTVSDAWQILQIIQGPDGHDQSMHTFPTKSIQEVDIGKLTVYPVPYNGRSRVHREVASSIGAAANALSKRGAKIVDRTFPNMKHAFEIWSAMLSAETAIPYGEILGQHRPLNPAMELARTWTGRGRHTFAAVFMVLADHIASTLPGIGRHFVEVGLGLQAELEEALGENAVLLHPPYNRLPPPHWDAFRTPFAPAYTAIFNVMEFPVTQVPTGFTKIGLPTGVQIAGARGCDHLTLAAAKVVESALGGWHQSFPESSQNSP